MSPWWGAPTGSLKRFIVCVALVAAGCETPAPPPREPTPVATVVMPAVAASSTPPASAVESAQVSVAVGDWKYFTVEGAVRAVVSRGDRVVAILGAEGHQSITFEGLAPGHATIVASDADGREMSIGVDVVEGRDGPCAARSVPVLGLAVVPDPHVHEWKAWGNGAGTLVSGEETTVTFERPGVLLVQSWDFDDRRRCAYYVADDPLACPSTIAIALGTERRFDLPPSKPQWRLVGTETARVEATSTERTLVLSGKKAGRAALWTRDAKTDWRCAIIDVTR